MGKVWSIYRTPGPDPIEINVAFFLVEICDFVIHSGMNVHNECVFARVEGDNPQPKTLLLLV
jgi:hypothetical protein